MISTRRVYFLTMFTCSAFTIFLISIPREGDQEEEAATEVSGCYCSQVPPFRSSGRAWQVPPPSRLTHNRAPIVPQNVDKTFVLREFMLFFMSVFFAWALLLIPCFHWKQRIVVSKRSGPNPSSPLPTRIHQYG